MVRYTIDEVTVGMQLAQSIFLPTGELLLGEGYEITERYISRLKDLGYESVMIHVEGTEDVAPEPLIPESVTRQLRQPLRDTEQDLKSALQRLRSSSDSTLDSVLNKNKSHIGKFIMRSGMLNAVEKFIDEILTTPELVLNLNHISQRNAELFAHAINVTITSLCIGRKYHFSYDELKQLAIGAMNFDIGLVALDPQIIKKRPQQLNAEEKFQYRQHTVLGHQLLSSVTTVPATSAAVALQHHEHQNGTGYPRGLRGENVPPQKDFSRQNMIHRFAEIVSVADMYDMLVSGRVIGLKLQPQQAVKQLITRSGKVLNADIVKTLLSIVPIYPVGARIKIVEAPSTKLIGYQGVVARDNIENLEKPQIIIFESRKAQKIDPILIDMARHQGIEIELVT